MAFGHNRAGSAQGGRLQFDAGRHDGSQEVRRSRQSSLAFRHRLTYPVLTAVPTMTLRVPQSRHALMSPPVVCPRGGLHAILSRRELMSTKPALLRAEPHATVGAVLLRDAGVVID